MDGVIANLRHIESRCDRDHMCEVYEKNRVKCFCLHEAPTQPTQYLSWETEVCCQGHTTGRLTRPKVFAKSENKGFSSLILFILSGI